MPSTTERTDEPIRRWPVWFARLANRVIGWTTSYCYGNCGYPVSTTLTHELERVGDIPIVVALCSTTGVCFRRVSENPHGPNGERYSEFRPQVLSALGDGTDIPGGRVILSLSA